MKSPLQSCLGNARFDAFVKDLAFELCEDPSHRASTWGGQVECFVERDNPTSSSLSSLSVTARSAGDVLKVALELPSKHIARQ